MQMLPQALAALPQSFCWTRFGPEAGETFTHILGRKERERRANSGVFYWGIGNALGPGIAELVRTSDRPEVLFSAIRSRPRARDVSPPVTVRWTVAEGLDGTRFEVPSAVVVHSAREEIASTRPHYALVCRSADPLDLREIGRIWFGALRNLRSGSPVGASQVTAVVTRLEIEVGAPYTVVFRAGLVAPYFVKLHRPVPVVASPAARA